VWSPLIKGFYYKITGTVQGALEESKKINIT
jgi:hypothetical protein